MNKNSFIHEICSVSCVKNINKTIFYIYKFIYVFNIVFCRFFEYFEYFLYFIELYYLTARYII